MALLSLRKGMCLTNHLQFSFLLPAWSIFIILFTLRSTSSQIICREFVHDAELVVNQQLLNEIEDQGISLQAVVDCLTDGGDITFAGSLEVPTIQIENSIRIQGRLEEAASVTCVDGPIFRVNAADVQLSNLEISGCHLDSEEDAPLVLLSGSNVQMTAVNFTNNRNRGGSAGLMIESDTELNVEGCYFRRNTGLTAHVLEVGTGSNITITGSVLRSNTGNGSTMNVTDGDTLTISSATFEDNTAYLGGGALRIESEQRRTTVVIDERSLFENNEAIDGEGGAILATGNVSLTIIEDTTFRRNRAANQGGALFVRGSSSLTIEDAFFIENESDFIGGGAIYAENDINADLDVFISNTIFSKNVAKNRLGSGGAIRLQGSTVTCIIELGVSFVSNVAELDGGAIHVSEGPNVTIHAISFTGNEVHHGGGAALFALSSLYSGSNIKRMSVRIESSTFVHNRAVDGRRGGGTLGFASLGTEVHIERCRFDGNEALFGSGGVIYLYDGPFVTVASSSFKDNKAIWGGVMYGEKRARYNVTACIFHRNQAEEGGVAKLRGAIDVDIINSDIRNNSAMEDGGAIRAENHVYDGGDRARFWFENNSVANNLAGYELLQGGFGSRITRGGGIVVIGTGQYVEIIDSTFRNNSASEGGAIAVIGPRQFLMTGQSHFEDNLANFGGALFIFVNNDIDIWGGLYRISDARFVNNTARSDGGAVRISSSTSANNLFPFNAYRMTVRFQDCVIRRNRAQNNGGGMMVTGVGLELQNVEFTRNTASLDVRVATSGCGGAIAAVDGAIVIVTESDIRNNVAHASGGGLFVLDSAVTVLVSNFSRNRAVNENANGGAVSLMLTSNRLIPTLEGDLNPRPVFFRCKDCRFVRNNASVHGGAIYHHHSDPSANYSETWNCDSLNVTIFEQIRTVEEFNLSCVAIKGTAYRLRDRHIRLFRAQFIHNEAQSGAGIFTNHPSKINITNGNLDSLGARFTDLVDNSTFLAEAGIIFTDNTISTGGYGPNYASFPRHAYMIARESLDDRRLLLLNNVRLGDFLRFSVEFQDAFHQRVTGLGNISAEIVLDKEGSGNLSLPVSDQTVAQIDNDGIIRFTGTRLQGNIGTNYKLSLRFLYRGEEVRMDESLRIDLTIESCRIGQTLNTEPDSRRCVDCGTGEFNADPMELPCQSCGYDEGRKCLGIVAIPEDHYWHVSSLEIKVYKCIGREACEFKNRFHRINQTEFEAHMNNTFVSHEHNDSYQCATGYHGILCGSCRPGYGREGESCRECASTGVLYLLLSMLILWSVGFVAYFIRSILQVSSKIEFNKKFGRSSISFPSKKGPRDERLSNSRPETDAFTSGSSSSETQTEGMDDLSVDVSSSPREFSTDAVREQTLFISSTVRPSRRDLARAMASEINRQRSSCRSGRQAGLASSLRRSKNRKRTARPARSHQLKDKPVQQTIQSLPLANPFSEVLKVLINFLQVTSVAVTINLEWSEAVRAALLSIGSEANFSTGSGFLSLDCFLESGSLPKSLQRMMMATLFPAALLILFVFLWGLYTVVQKRTLKYFLQRTWVTTLAVVYFFYINLTKNLLRFFACVKIEEDIGETEDARRNSTLDGYYWEEDTSVQCYRNKHALIVGILAVPLLCMVAIGFPLGTLVVLQLKAEHLEEEDVVGTYGFLYQSYDQRFWEVLVMLRKASIAVIVVFVYSLGANMQGLLCVLVLMIALSLHLSFVPFREEMHRLNYLETCSLSTSIAVFVSGLMLNDRETNKESEIFLSIFAILCVVLTLCLILINLILSGEEFMDMKLLEHRIVDRDELLNLGISTKSWRLISHYVSTMKNHLSIKIKGTSSNKKSNQNMGSSTQMAESSSTQSV